MPSSLPEVGVAFTVQPAIIELRQLLAAGGHIVRIQQFEVLGLGYSDGVVVQVIIRQSPNENLAALKLFTLEFAQSVQDAASKFAWVAAKQLGAADEL